MSKIDYKPRFLEKNILRASRLYPVILVTGARQTGKSTLLAHLYPNIKHITFDPIEDLYNARQEPDLFLDNFSPPLILDEIQYAPELLPAIKRRVDANGNSGQYFLTGSQNLSIMKSVSESLAGRVAIFECAAMTQGELRGLGNESAIDLEIFFNKSIGDLKQFFTISEKNIAIAEIMWRGGLPKLLNFRNSDLPLYFSSYIQTYIERDVRLLENIKDLSDFRRFCSVCSVLSSCELNHSQLGRDIGISNKTSQRWLKLLQHSFLWFELAPWHGNSLKRLSKKNKGIFTDSGLLTYLQHITSPEALLGTPALGRVFESFIINEIRKHKLVMNVKPEMYHWRSNGGAEVDLVLELNYKLCPIEIKYSKKVSSADSRGIRAFKETYPEQVSYGIIIYGGDEILQINPFTIALPWTIF